MKMATMLNEDNVQQKLECITSAQDSIQSVSLWIIHHKSESNQIVRIWLKVLKKADVSQKLLLFYLCNDVVQNCKRKQAVEYLESFKGVLSESIQLVKDTTIKPKVLRILNIWQERNVYKAKFITKLKAILEGDSKTVTPAPVKKEVYKATKKEPKSNGTKESKVKETPPVEKIDSAQLLAEFKPQLFIHKVTDLRKLELENDIKQQQLSKVKFDESSLDTIKQLKDKSQGKEFSKNFEEAVAKLESTVKYLEQDVNDRGEVIDLAETSELFYDEQYKEAKIVVNAYRNFGTRINNMKKKVEDIKNKFPATPSPIPSPTGLLDAPSPEPTPPQEDPNDYTDPLDMEIDSDDEKKQKRAANDPRASHNKRTRCSNSVPSIEPVNMPVNSLNLKPIVPTGVPAPIIVPVLSGESATLPGGFTPIDSPRVYPPAGVPAPVIVPVPEQVLTPVKEHSTSKVKHKDKSDKSHKKSHSRLKSVVSIVNQEEKKSVPNRSSKDDSDDEGCSTPVQDETMETVVQKENPIDFLTKLLSKTNSAVPASGASFLQNLSLLTSTVKSEFEHSKGTIDSTDQKDITEVPSSKEWHWNEGQSNSQNQSSTIPPFSGYSPEVSDNSSEGQNTDSKISVQATLTPQVVSSINQNLTSSVQNIPPVLDLNATSGLSAVNALQQSPSPEIPTPGLNPQYPPNLALKDQHGPVLPPHMLVSQPTSPEMYPLAAPPTSSSLYLGQQRAILSSVYSVQPPSSEMYPQHTGTQPPVSPLIYPGHQNLPPNSSTDVYLGAPPIFSSNVYPHQQPPSPDIYSIQPVSGVPQYNMSAGLTTPSPEVLSQTPIYSNLHSAFGAPPPPPPPVTQSQPTSGDSGIDDILNQIVTGEGFSDTPDAANSNDPFGSMPHFANDSFLTNFKPTASFLSNSPSKAYNSGQNTVPYSRSNSSGAVVIPLSESYNEDPGFSQPQFIEALGSDERDPSEDIEDFSEKLSHGNVFSYDRSRPNLTCLTPQEDNDVQQFESIRTISTVGSHEPKIGRQNVEGLHHRQSVVRHIEPEPNQEDFTEDVSMETPIEHSEHDIHMEERNFIVRSPVQQSPVRHHPSPRPAMRPPYPHSPRLRPLHHHPPPPPEHFYGRPPRRPYRHPGERFRGPPRDPYFYDDPYGPPPPKRPYPPPDGHRRRPFYRH